MSERMLKFGDVVRVDPDPKINPHVKQPDDRRWMVISRAVTGRNPWTLMFIGPVSSYTALSGVISHWPSLHGFCLAGVVE